MTERTSSAEHTKESMKEKVKMGVAKTVGAIEGFTKQAKEDQLIGKTKDAAKKVSQTSRGVADTAREEGRRTKEAVAGRSTSPGPGPSRPPHEGSGTSSLPGTARGLEATGAAAPSFGRPGPASPQPWPATGPTGSASPAGDVGNPVTREAAGAGPERGLGRTASRPGSPGTTRRSEGHARTDDASAAARRLRGTSLETQRPLDDDAMHAAPEEENAQDPEAGSSAQDAQRTRSQFKRR